MKDPCVTGTPGRLAHHSRGDVLVDRKHHAAAQDRHALGRKFLHDLGATLGAGKLGTPEEA